MRYCEWNLLRFMINCSCFYFNRQFLMEIFFHSLFFVWELVRSEALALGHVLFSVSLVLSLDTLCFVYGCGFTLDSLLSGHL